MYATVATGVEFSGVEPYAPELKARYTLYPLTLLALALQASPTECDEPDNVAPAEFVALLLMLALPLSDPVPGGVN